MRARGGRGEMLVVERGGGGQVFVVERVDT